ncbi:unnamed protein product [Arctogadus glacialis]
MGDCSLLHTILSLSRPQLIIHIAFQWQVLRLVPPQLPSKAPSSYPDEQVRKNDNPTLPRRTQKDSHPEPRVHRLPALQRGGETVIAKVQSQFTRLLRLAHSKKQALVLLLFEKKWFLSVLARKPDSDRSEELVSSTSKCELSIALVVGFILALESTTRGEAREIYMPVPPCLLLVVLGCTACSANCTCLQNYCRKCQPNFSATDEVVSLCKDSRVSPSKCIAICPSNTHPKRVVLLAQLQLAKLVVEREVWLVDGT